jgi:hypothetical protein
MSIFPPVKTSEELLSDFLEFGKIDEVYGAGKGGGGGGGEEADDTLSSKQTIRALIAISEGTIESVPEVYLNNTPSTSYKRVSYETRLGTADQTFIDGFSKVESPHPDTTTVELPYGTRITRTVTSADVDSLRVTLGLNSLYQMNSQKNIVGYTISFDIYTRKNSSEPWGAPVKTTTKAGKTRNPYAWTFRVKRPAGAEGELWQVSIIRTTEDDNTSNKASSKTSLVGVIEIQNEIHTYPNTALIGVTIGNAIRLGGNIPTIACRPYGMKLKVPTSSIYNAATGAYTSTIWDGSFDLVERWTPNPAWILYNVLTNTSWGLGIPESKFDKFSFFNLAVYCDEQVNDGKGGTERRYELHNQFMSREDTPTFLMYLLTICNANLVPNNFGLLAVTFDHLEDPDLIIGNNEVLDGMFEYSSTNLEERFTQVNVTWNDEALFGGTNTSTWPPESPGTFEQGLIDRYGVQPTDIILAGCMSERQALWKARYIFYTTCVDTNIVSFRTMLYGMAFRVGQVIEIVDNDNINVLRTAKIVDYNFIDPTNLEITLDGPVTLTADAFTIQYWSASGLVEYPILETSGTFSVVTIDEAVAVATPYFNTDVYLSGDVQPTKWKVASISVDPETQIHSITALQYSPEKWAYVEDALVVGAPNTLGIPANSVAPVESVSVTREIYNDGIKAGVNLNVKWLWFESDTAKTDYNTRHAAWVSGGEIGPEPIPINSQQVAFQVSYRRNNGNYTLIPTSYSMSAVIEDAVFGVYNITIVAVSSTGLESVDTTFTYTYLAGEPSTLLPPINFYVEGTTAYEFVEEILNATFEYDPDNDTKDDRLSVYIMEVYDTAGTTLKNTYTISPNSADGGRFTYTLQQNTSDFGTPTREFMLKVYSMDTIGGLSTANAQTFSNPAPAATSLTVEMGADTATVTLPERTGDTAGYLVHMSQTDGFTPSGANKQYEGEATKATIYLPAPGVYYFKAAAFDAFGQDSLNYSTQVSGTGIGLPGNKITPNSLMKTDNYQYSGDVTVSTGIETAIASYDFTSNQSAGTLVALSVNTGFGTPVVTTRVKLEVFNTSDVSLGSFYLYFRDGQQLDSRYFYGGKSFSLTVPSDGKFRIKTIVRHASGSDKDYNDPFLDILETIR